MEFPRLSTQRRALLAQATERYAGALAGSPGEEYLAGRGIDLGTAELFQLGYVESPVEGQDRFAGRIAIPYLTPSGPVGMRFRYATDELTEKQSKFDSEDAQRTALYNVLDLHKTDPWVALCEGEPDTVVMSGLVGVPAVGIPGVEHFIKKGSVWGRLFQDYETVFICMDPDKAGRKIVKAIAQLVENPVVIDLPADVNDTYKEFGADFILETMGLN